MSPSGSFYGKYGAPTLLENTVKKLRMRFLEAGHVEEGGDLHVQTDDRFYFENEKDRRHLATADVDYSTASLRNPVMCVSKGDSMMFTIRDPLHYP